MGVGPGPGQPLAIGTLIYKKELPTKELLLVFAVNEGKVLSFSVTPTEEYPPSYWVVGQSYQLWAILPKSGT